MLDFGKLVEENSKLIERICQCENSLAQIAMQPDILDSDSVRNLTERLYGPLKGLSPQEMKAQIEERYQKRVISACQIRFSTLHDASQLLGMLETLQGISLTMAAEKWKRDISSMTEDQVKKRAKYATVKIAQGKTAHEYRLGAEQELTLLGDLMEELQIKPDTAVDTPYSQYCFEKKALIESKMSPSTYDTMQRELYHHISDCYNRLTDTWLETFDTEMGIAGYHEQAGICSLSDALEEKKTLLAGALQLATKNCVSADYLLKTIQRIDPLLAPSKSEVMGRHFY